MRNVSITSELEAPAEVVWRAMKTPHAFVHVSKGVLRYPVAERLNRPWRTGDDITGWTFLLEFVPFSKHHLSIESIDDGAMTLVSMENGGIVRRWRHHLITTPIDDRSCQYEDRIEIDAGLWTPIVAAFAVVFYNYRQHRWKVLARLLAAVVSEPDATL